LLGLGVPLLPQAALAFFLQVRVESDYSQIIKIHGCLPVPEDFGFFPRIRFLGSIVQRT
jgi:hypothetical protein